ncbi:MAG: Tex family protein [Halanaerobium sp.]|nr:Tex family protein [Halanaerobium sp.]
MVDIIKVIGQELKIERDKVAGTVKLLDDNNTIPFIARYRKEATGSLNETQIRDIKERLDYLRNLEERKGEVIRLIAEQDQLTAELQAEIEKATILQQVEDLYRPYRPKRQSRAQKARDKGLQPLAELALSQEMKAGDPALLAKDYLDPERELIGVNDVLQGMRDILAEEVTDSPRVRKKVRNLFWQKARLVSSLAGQPDEKGIYKMYYEYAEPVRAIPPHRTLAINRGEKEDVLKVKVELSEEEALDLLYDDIITGESIFLAEIKEAVRDGYKRLLAPSLKREIRSELTEKAEEHASKVFARNLRNLLLAPPVKGRVVMGIDPAYRTGCKIAVVDPWGKLLRTATIYPHEPRKRWEEALGLLSQLVEKYQVDYIAIGNGTASRETEELAAELIQEQGELEYIIVDEAGASVYSASPLAREEFPELDVAMRGAVSIARRLQDPLAELVKIEPRSIGVGLYQHDIAAGRLDDSLQAVVESCVNYVGVDLNSASPALLEYVAGINKRVAGNIVRYREDNGPFRTRKQLMEIRGFGEKTFEQCAGFLRIPEGENPFANTPIHPESYDSARRLLERAGFQAEDLRDSSLRGELVRKIKSLDLPRIAGELAAGLPTLQDIAEALQKPGRDPRESLPKPIFRKDVLKISDLSPGLVLKGTVRNVVDFGAFVDIGVKEDGLVHISEMREGYVKDPLDIVQAGDIINVRVLSVDEGRGRISLSMKGI